MSARRKEKRGATRDGREQIQIAGIGELIDDEDAASVSLHGHARDRRSDEAGTAGDEKSQSMFLPVATPAVSPGQTERYISQGQLRRHGGLPLVVATVIERAEGRVVVCRQRVFIPQRRILAIDTRGVGVRPSDEAHDGNIQTMPQRVICNFRFAGRGSRPGAALGVRPIGQGARS